MPRSIRPFRVGLLSLVAGVLLASGCQVNPTTGKSQFNILSMQEEIALGEGSKSELTQEYGGAVQNAELQNYVTQIGKALAAQTEGDNPSLPWEFTLLDSDVINAFALPGGKVFMSRGLAEKLTTEAELAAVLGHEVGHVTARHSGQRVSQSMVVAGLAVGAGLAASGSDSDLVRVGLPLIVGAGGQGYLLKYGRGQELEADALGVRYMVKLGYDPMGARMVQEVLQREAGSGGQPEFLSTHPYPESRIAQVDKLLKGEYAYTQNNPDFNLHQERYQRQFLSKLAARNGEDDARLAAAQLSARLNATLVPQNRVRNGRLMINANAMHDPASFCAHCAGAAPQPLLGP